MPSLPTHLVHAIQSVREDRTSGASAILDTTIAILREARQGGVAVEAARGLCQAQPSMASVWNASLNALAADASTARFERFVERVARAPSALTRAAAGILLGVDRPDLRLLTISSSASVVRIVEHLRRDRPVTVFCSEGRPALEGRSLATGLVSLGVRVVYFTDAALTLGLDESDAVLVGADAVGPHAWLNKSGTFALAAAASIEGRPFYVAATRDKLAMPALWPLLAAPREGAPDEVWSDPPPGATVRNACFEPVPLDLVTGVVSDAGLLGAGMVPDACEAMQDAQMLAALEQLTFDL